MSILDISLTAGMRASLLSLQGAKKNIDRTQERLSTGKKVNSALDNPTNFFAAISHINRAADLNARKDGILEGIQTIKAADAGISGISTLLNSMKGMTQAALGTSSQTDRNAYQASFDELANQITSIANDSSYRGTNLLNSQNLTMEFSEISGTSTLTVAGADNTAQGLGVSPDTYISTRGADLTSYFSITKNGKSLSVPTPPMPLGSSDYIGASGTTTYIAYYDFFLDFNYYSFDVTSGASSWTDAGYTTPPGVNFNMSPATTTVPPKLPWTSDSIIKNAEASVDSAFSTLRSRSSMLSSNLDIARTRLDFISSMGNVLQTGAENLTLADMNEEGAKMLALQVGQNLGVSSLSMASKASQSILQLF